MSILTAELIENSICNLREEWVKKGSVEKISDINRAWCWTFAEELLWDVLHDKIGVPAESIKGDLGKMGDSGVYYLSNEHFWVFKDAGGKPLKACLVDEDLDEYYPWNIEMLDKFHIKPPLDLTWEQMNQIPFGYHVFIVFENKFYDAETPAGVFSFFELPLYKEILREHLADINVAKNM